jgi:hypothetical protein
MWFNSTIKYEYDNYIIKDNFLVKGEKVCQIILVSNQINMDLVQT